MKKKSILIVDDEKNTREGLARALTRQYEVAVAEDGKTALDILSSKHVDMMLSDIRMPGMDGMTLMQRALARQGDLICVLLTAYGSIETAVEAMKRGAYDFLTKPVHLDQLDILIRRAFSSTAIERENQDLKEQLNEKYGMENIVGQSPAMHEVFDIIKQVAASRVTVLIEGESGTGKELAAHAVHHLSPRSKAPFIAVHCAALSSTLLESELFGHEKGSFTGASEMRKGRFELADGGTLFLDEIGEIDMAVQVKILRVLEEQRFERVGGQTTLDVDVRVITATNRDLKKMVLDGTFREDLFYRLNVVPLMMPPLRNRKMDIPLLIDTFVKEANKKHGRSVEGLTAEAIDALNRYDWPGNVRELRNAVEHMVVLCRGNRLGVRDIPLAIREQVPGDSVPKSISNLSMEQAEKQLIESALKMYGGNRTRAAEHLGISRRTLHRKLNEFGLRES